MKSQITRRNFLAGSAVAAGLLGLTSCEGETSATGGLAAPDLSTYPIDPDGEGVAAKYEIEEIDARSGGFKRYVQQDGAPTISTKGGKPIIQIEGYAFKDFDGDGKLSAWEDWRQPASVRAAELAAILPLEWISGLLLHVSGMSMDDEGFLDLVKNTHIREAINFSTQPYLLHARWNNTVQELAESEDYGIPVTISCNPETLSGWPGSLGIAASFDPEFASQIYRLQGRQYRAAGLQTLLGPQIDIASDPRWNRIEGTYGEDPALSRDMTRAAIDGLQSTYDEEGNDLGWGEDSVIAMMKHFPGDGTGESGRESHTDSGKYAVYPGDNFDTSLIPFVDGGLTLDGKTESCASVMTSYSIAYSDDGEYGEPVGSAYSSWKIDLLRQGYGFDGLICSDWSVTSDPGQTNATCWGVEDISKTERYARLFMAGCDQIGGGSDNLCMDALEIMKGEMGEEAAEAAFRDHGRRVLETIFKNFHSENPFVDSSKVDALLTGADAVALTREAQTRGIVMLKNAGGLISERSEKPRVYIPQSFSPEVEPMYGGIVPGSPASWDCGIDPAIAANYIDLVTDIIESADPEHPTENDMSHPDAETIASCDFALVFMDAPFAGSAGSAPGQGAVFNADYTGVEYVPIPLVYGSYTASGASVREVSISGDTLEDGSKENRSYKGKANQVSNSSELDKLLATIELMDGKPVIACINASKPLVVSEFEDRVQGILASFGSDNEAFLAIASGQVEPSGLLPLQFPASMDAVEAQLEDTPRDMDCHVDSEGNIYDFAYGLDWSGVIDDGRVATYRVDPILKPEKARN